MSFNTSIFQGRPTPGFSPLNSLVSLSLGVSFSLIVGLSGSAFAQSQSPVQGDTPIASAFPEASPTPPIQTSAIPEGEMLTPPDTLPTAQGILPDDEPEAGNPATAQNQDTESSVENAAIPPDPNVLDSAVNTPIYSMPLNQAPAPLDTPTDENDGDNNSPYNALSIMLWSCFIAAAAATSYFLYIRFGESRA